MIKLLVPFVREEGYGKVTRFHRTCLSCVRKGLSSLIREDERHGSLHGNKVCRGAPSVSHLFFADDSFLFFLAFTKECHVLKDILGKFEAASGLAVNYHKSNIMFSSNMATNLQHSLCNILGVHQPLNTGKRIGLPSLIGRSKKSIFSFLKDRLWNRLHALNNKILSRAEKEILIKAIAQVIPSYCMNDFLIPVTLTDKLERMMNSFWYGSKKNGEGV